MGGIWLNKVVWFILDQNTEAFGIGIWETKFGFFRMNLQKNTIKSIKFQLCKGWKLLEKLIIVGVWLFESEMYM